MSDGEERAAEFAVRLARGDGERGDDPEGENGSDFAGGTNPHPILFENKPLRDALSLAIGSQAMIALLDTGRLDPQRARDVARFACRAIAAEAERMMDAHDRTPATADARG